MAVKPQPPAHEPQPERPRTEREPPQDAERYGPLQLTRLAKADGRALILYRRSEPPRT